MPARSRLLAPAVAAVATVATGVAVASCGGDKTGDAKAFCAELQPQAPALLNPQLETPEDVDAYLEAYRSLAETVPLAIEEEWGTLLGAYETAASAVPGDDASIEVARRAIFGAESSSIAIRDWVTANCGFDLASVGPVATVGGGPAPTTTSVPGG